VALAEMSDAREVILGRIRDALRATAPIPTPAPRAYRRTDGRDRAALVELMCERVRDYGARAERMPADAVGSAIREACAASGLRRVVVAPGVPAAWRPDGAAEVVADEALTPAELDAVDGVITGCATAIAETGTLVLDGGPLCGRRALSLVPDHHICVVAAEQIVGQVPEAIAALAPAVAERRVPVTLVSGSSATSDIELERVEGVHGPRHLLVLIAV
jgi:L-lactate dehydrogenase complex protein LldG